MGTGVIQNAADNTGFKDLVETTIDNLNMTPASIIADGAYGSCENLEYLKEKGITSYAKYNGFERENKKLKKGELYRKEHFQYDTEKDIFICPNEKILEFSNERQEIKNIKRIYFYLKEKWELLKKSYTINMHTN